MVSSPSRSGFAIGFQVCVYLSVVSISVSRLFPSPLDFPVASYVPHLGHCRQTANICWRREARKEGGRGGGREGSLSGSPAAFTTAVHPQLLPVHQPPTRCRGAVRSVCPRFPVLKLWREAPSAGPGGYSFLLLSLPLRVGPPLAWPLLPWGSAQPSRPAPGTARKPAAASHPLTGHVGAGNSPALNMLLVHGLPGSAGAPGG